VRWPTGLKQATRLRSSPEISQICKAVPATNRTLADFFESFARLPEQFIIYDDGYRRWTYTYAQIANAARAFALRLDKQSIAPGDRILFWSENRPEWLAAFWGCLLQKAVVVPIDYHASAQVVLTLQRTVGAKAILVGDAVEAENLGHNIAVWLMREIDLSGKPPPAMRSLPIDPGDTAEIVFTSGSTATPKGVVITHRNIMADLAPIEREVATYRTVIRLLSPIRLVLLLPLSHMFGQALATFFPPMLPGQVILMRTYAAPEVIRQIRGRRAALLVAVPRTLETLRRHLIRKCPDLASDRPDHSHWIIRRWRYRHAHRPFGVKFLGFVVGGAALEAELEAFWRRLGFIVVQGYGLTETAPIVAFNHPFHPKPGTVGKPLAGVEVRTAADGEIMVRGDIVTPGYYNAPADACAAFEDGWFHTGDIGAIDQDGYITVRGRKKEMIVTPEGLKVFPEDVELVLNRIPGVRDSAVVGADRVHAVLVIEQDADVDEIVRRANEQLESHQKIRAVSVWTAGKLPRTEGTGKLKRAAIQKWVDAGTTQTSAQPHDGLMELIRRYAPDRHITPDSTLDELGLSSLDKVELVVELEDRFDLEIDEARLDSHVRIADLLQQIAQPGGERESMGLPDWNLGLAARLLRRILIPALVLPITRACAHIKVRGLQALDGVAGPVIFASNHQSHFDTPVIMAALPRRLRYTIAPAMWKEFFDAYFHPQRYSLFSRLTSAIYFYGATLVFNGFTVPQQEAGIRQSIRHMGNLVSDGWSLLIFPEGERTRTGAIQPFQPGVGMIASRLRLPLIPIRLRGVDRVLPRGSRVVHPGPVEVSFGPPMELAGDDFAALADKVRAQVSAL